MHSTEQETRAGRACGGPDKTAREDAIVLCPIARIRTAFPTKFGIPRQSGIVPSLPGKIVFAREFAQAEALRGIGEYSHLWLVWQFSAALREHWSATVRPPRLGGNTRVGVFATRSPFRPNGLGLSSVRLERVEWDTPDGPVLHVSGVDLMDGTPILDIKPPTFPPSTAMPMRQAALRTGCLSGNWRFGVPGHCWTACRPRCGRLCLGCFARIHGPITRKIRTGSTGSVSAVLK